MSGAFETAAGAFAVVGVAEVVVRTGLELCRFIQAVKDAPQSMRDLRKCVQEVNALVYDCEKLRARAQLHHVAISITSLESALRALERELQNLKLRISKYNGASKTWSRVKYVLDERRVEKSLISLERSKTLLMNALTIACE